MTNKSYIPILAVLGAIMLVVVAAIAPPQSFLGRDVVYAQTPDDATLDETNGLTLSTGVTLSPIFAPNTMTYSARADSGTDRVTVTATPNNPNADVTISPRDADTSVEGHQVILRGGRETVITVKVTSEDRSLTETYTITVYQERTTPSDDNTLSSLRLSGVTLSQSFASDRTSYTGRAIYSTTETTVSARKADIGATVEVRDANAAGTEPVTGDPGLADDDSDTPGVQVELTAGEDTVIFVVVTPEDSTADRG